MRVVGSIHTICFRDMLSLLQVQTKATSNDKSRIRFMIASVSITRHRDSGTDTENKCINYVHLLREFQSRLEARVESSQAR